MKYDIYDDHQIIISYCYQYVSSLHLKSTDFLCIIIIMLPMPSKLKMKQNITFTFVCNI